MNQPDNDIGLAPQRTKIPLFPSLALLALLVAMFWWTGRWMIARWEQPAGYYSHGWLIPAVIGWLLWRKRRAIADCPRQPYSPGLSLLVPALLIHLLATAWQIGFLSGVALLGVVAGLVLTLLGPKLFRVVLFPIAFLAFMVPAPEVAIETISFRMKLLSAGVATGVADLLGLVAVRRGSFIQIPNGTLVVDTVCSGLKYLISLMAFGALYAHLSSVKTWQKWVLFLLSLPVSFLANVGRVTLMVIVGYQWGVPTVEKWYFHDLFGFVLFIVAFICLFAVESLMLLKAPWLRLGKTEAAPAPQPAAPPAPPVAQPPRRSRALGAGVMCAVAAVAALSLLLSWQRQVRPTSDILAAIPKTLGDWRGVDHPLDESVYQILGTRDVLSRSYVNSKGDRLALLIVLAQQTRSRTHAPEQCLAGDGYTVIGSCERAVTMPSDAGPRTFDVRELQLSHDSGQRISWYFYKSGDHLTTSYWRHQIGIALRKLTDPLAADALIRAEANADPDDAERGRRLLNDFFTAATPYILSKLP